MKKSKKQQDFLSWFLPAFGALLCWGIWGFLPKLALQTLSPPDIVFYESLGNLAVAAPLYFIFLKRRIEKDRRSIVFAGLTSLLTVIAILAYIQALSMGPVSIIAPLAALYPVISIVLAWVFLKERINRLQMVAIVLSMASIILLAS